MKRRYCVLLVLFFMVVMPRVALANNIAVENISLVDQDTTNDTFDIQFDVAWDNSWFITGAPSATANWDAAWVFVKFSTYSSGTWSNWAHCTLLNSGNVAPSGSQMSFGATGSAYKGVFIYRSAAGTGTVDWDDAEIRWDYGTDGVSDSATIKVKVFAIEMVLVPGGFNFSVGDGTSSNIRGQFEAATSGSAFQVTGEGALTLGGGGAGSLGNNNASGMVTADDFNDTTTQTLPANFPKGYNAFYIMKYEISQGQYRDFLNTLTRTQQNTRTASQTANQFVMSNTSSVTNRNGIRAPSSIPSGAITFGCDLDADGTFDESDDGEWIACNYLSWADFTAYADWAGLRPFSELEFEKAARGGQTAVADEYAWGSTSITQATGITNSGQTNEVSSNSANCVYGGHASVQGPLRCGSLTDSDDTRAEAGAGYYGIMELSGNLWELSVIVGNSTGRLFTGLHGDGALDSNGDADVTNWPGTSATGGGGRGGARDSIAISCRVSDRWVSGFTDSTRGSSYGGRCARTSPQRLKVLRNYICSNCE